MRDPTESIRRQLIEHGVPIRAAVRALAHKEKTWTTDELRAEFEVLGFMAPIVVLKRRSDGVKGCMMFTHSPRLYFNWREDEPAKGEDEPAKTE